MDFSENYAIKEQSEIQAAHWFNEQLTVFTAATWGPEPQSFAFISDCLSHDKFAVLVFLQKLLEFHPEKCKIHIFTDGAASQFKNSFIMTAISNYVATSDTILDINWSFFATSHGKGAVDGIGGEVKRMVWTTVKTGRDSVRSMEDFIMVARQKSTKIKVKY
jgi:hypothetical protein